MLRQDDSPGKNIELLEWCKRPEIRFMPQAMNPGAILKS
jgi:2-keto-3-deoxy-6-phosphogluconate aldolase